jgi:tetratricopeptide (TPR) repeat protein
VATKVFVSSTAKDLAQWRAAVADALAKADGVDCIQMENFGARPDTPRDFCEKKVHECDLFVGIIGVIFGSTPEDAAESYTQIEYLAAKAAGKPRLMFVAPSDFRLAFDMIEPDDRRQKQIAFRAAVMQDPICDTFTTPEDLKTRVLGALRNWERTSTPQAPPRLRTVPLPPQPYFVHPYPLQKHFTGRHAERAVLTEWFEHPRQSVLSIVAIGGMGKSALSWVWVQSDVLGFGDPGNPATTSNDFTRVCTDLLPEGIFWWSFYEQDASFRAFTEEFYRYVTGTDVPTDMRPSELVRHTIAALQQRRIIVIFDGFERELQAYSHLAAAYQGDQVMEDARGDFRRCASLTTSDFLRRATGMPLRGKILVSTRLHPRELDGVASARQLDLKGLSEDDAVIFLKSAGVRGSLADRRALCERFGHHPLVLRLLAGMIVHDPVAPGDISVAATYAPVRDAISREHHILDLSYASLSVDVQHCLSTMAAFRSPTAYPALAALELFHSEQQLRNALRELIDRGLLFFMSTNPVRYDLHPVVRQYAYERLLDKQNIHSRIRDYFTTASSGIDDEIASVEDLQPLTEVFHQTVKSGQYDEAASLYVDRLYRIVQYRLGEVRLFQELLETLFEDPIEAKCHVANPRVSLILTRALVNSYTAQGDLAKAAHVGDAVRERFVLGRDDVYGEFIADLAKDVYHPLGKLIDAEALLLEALIYLNDDFEHHARGHVHHAMAELMFDRGHLGKAAVHLRRSRDEYIQGRSWDADHEGPYLTVAADIHERRASDPSLVLRLRRRRLEAAVKTGSPSHLISGRLGMAEALLSSGDAKQLDRAEELLSEALTLCRQMDASAAEAATLISLARVFQLRRDSPRTEEVVREARELTETTQSRALLVRVHLLLSSVARDAGKLREAGSHAAMAYERAWCDGGSYSFYWLLRDAEHALKQLDIPIPILKPRSTVPPTLRAPRGTPSLGLRGARFTF